MCQQGLIEGRGHSIESLLCPFKHTQEVSCMHGNFALSPPKFLHCKRNWSSSTDYPLTCLCPLRWTTLALYCFRLTDSMWRLCRVSEERIRAIKYIPTVTTATTAKQARIVLGCERVCTKGSYRVCKKVGSEVEG